MKFLKFTFKNEAVWMLLWPLGVFLIGSVIAVIFFLTRG